MTDFSQPPPALNKILLSLPQEVRDFLDKRAETRDMKVGDVIFEEGALVTHAVFPHEGVISLIARMENGRSVEKSLIGPEGFIGFAIAMGGRRVLGQSVVQVAGRASWVPAAEVEVALLRFECLRDTMLRFTKAHIVQLMESLACTSLHSAEQRVSRWLLQAHDRVEGDTFHITQETVATLLALRRATVNAVCADLMGTGAISYHRGALSVVNRDRLLDKACECYGRIQLAASV
jgi:CRP-like cAMP-binding protein